jgi:hypothetical protein
MLMFPPQGKFAADDKAYWSTKEDEAGLSLSAAFTITIVLFGNVFHTFTQSSGAGNSDHTIFPCFPMRGLMSCSRLIR